MQVSPPCGGGPPIGWPRFGATIPAAKTVSRRTPQAKDNCRVSAQPVLYRPGVAKPCFANKPCPSVDRMNSANRYAAGEAPFITVNP
jgi:hypothetical protein